MGDCADAIEREFAKLGRVNRIEQSVRLESLRSAVIAGRAQSLVAEQCMKSISPPLDLAVAKLCPKSTMTEIESRRRGAVVPLSLNQTREFAGSVWRTERPHAPPLQVSRQEDMSEATRRAHFNPDGAAEARWALPFADQVGLKRAGDLAGTAGLVPYIDVTDEALNRLSLLHEIAHLLVDTDVVLHGHDQLWVDEFGRLIGSYIDPFTGIEWEAMRERAGDWAAKKVTENPDWLADVLA